MSCQHVQAALVAAGDGGKDDARLPFKPFRASVYKRFERCWIVLVHHRHERCINPSPSFDLGDARLQLDDEHHQIANVFAYRVQAADNDIELQVVCLILVLNLAMVRRDFDARHPALDEFGCCLSFRSTDILLSAMAEAASKACSETGEDVKAHRNSHLNRNCRFKLDTSMVSMSMT